MLWPRGAVHVANRLSMTTSAPTWHSMTGFWVLLFGVAHDLREWMQTRTRRTELLYREYKRHSCAHPCESGYRLQSKPDGTIKDVRERRLTTTSGVRR